ncbi:MAG: helix-turn-helix domain-containing protein [Parvularculaceae bacterium]|nr:helix-turn-helix domain-containing protein [Parvularculaceae bacterium]
MEKVQGEGTGCDRDNKRLLISLRESSRIAGYGDRTNDPIALADHFHTLRNLSERSADEALHLSHRPLAPGSIDFVLDTLVHAETLEAAMRQAARAFNLLHGGYYNRVEQRRDRLAFIIDDRAFPYAPSFEAEASYVLMEGLLIFLHAMLGLVVDRAALPVLGVRTRRPNRPSPDGLLSFWEAPVRTGAATYAIEYGLQARTLSAAHPSDPPATTAAVYDYIDQLIAEREEREIQRDLPERVLASLYEGVNDQKTVARLLGVSVATLRRRLADAGVSFRDLRKTALNARSHAMLAQGRPVLAIIEELGFSDIRSFTRAFKEWNGFTPNEFVKRIRKVRRDEN